MINDIEVIDMPDGSTKVSMDLEPEMQKMLMKQGLEYIIKEMKMHEKIKVMDCNEFSEDVKTLDLSDDEYNALFHFGFISAIKNAMK